MIALPCEFRDLCGRSALVGGFSAIWALRSAVLGGCCVGRLVLCLRLLDEEYLGLICFGVSNGCRVCVIVGHWLELL